MSLDYSIQLLDTHVIHQLKSTLVISTFPECVKELIYNAIDANSKNIEISIDTEKYCIQVNDNGTGISFQDLNSIGQRHATSKHHQNHTFGFRGEALASIIQQSIVQIISRHHTSTETFTGLWRDGTKIGKITQFKHRKALPGTTIIVRDLFYKYPVRRKYRSTSQHGAVTESVKQYLTSFAVCFPTINFILIDSARNTKLLVSKKTEDSLGVFRQLFGQSVSQYMIPLEMQKDEIKVNGYFSTKYYPNKTLQFIYVNNHLVPRNELYKLVNELLPFSDSDIETGSSKGKSRLYENHPIFMIKLDNPQWSSFHINPYLEVLADISFFDVLKLSISQITLKFLELQRREIPKKKIVKRRKLDTSTLSSTIDSQSIFSAHSSANHQPKKIGETKIVQNENFLRWWDPDQQKEFLIDRRTGNSYPVESLYSESNNLYAHTNKINRSNLKTQFTSANNQDDDDDDDDAQIPSSSNMNIEGVGTRIKLSKAGLQTALVLGQVDKKYIMVKIESKLVMIDQHAADERVKLESMTARICAPEMNHLITLEPSIPIRLTLSRNQLVNERLSRFLKYWGIHIATNHRCDDISNGAAETIISHSRYFSTNDASPHFTESREDHSTRFYVTRLPRLIADRCLQNPQILNDLIIDYMHWIEQEEHRGQDSALIKVCPRGIMEILKSKACRAAIMFNDPLTLQECETLIKKLSYCKFPFQCAHGRPSAIPIVSDVSLMYKPINRKVHWNKFDMS